MTKLGYVASYYMPLLCSSRYVTVMTTIFSISSIYLIFFLSSNFLQSSYTDEDSHDDKAHLFVPNEQDYFRTCLLGIFSPLFFNFLRNFLLKFPSENPTIIVLSNIFIDYCIYDWFLFLIIYFLAYPQLDTSKNNGNSPIHNPNNNFDIVETVRNVFHIIPKQSYILAICWSLSECVLSILENLPLYQEIVPPNKGADEEMGLSKPNDLNIISYCYQRMKNGLIDSVYNIISKPKVYYKESKRYIKSKIFKKPEVEENLPTKIDLSRCADVLQKANMQQKCVQYQISDLLKKSNESIEHNENKIGVTSTNSNNSFSFDGNNHQFINPLEGTNDNIDINQIVNKHTEDVVFINFKDQTMHVEKVPQDELNYGSINFANSSNSNKQNNHSKNGSGRGSNRSNNNNNNNNNHLSTDGTNNCDPIIEIVKMGGKPRPGHLFTNKNVWQVKKETEILKLGILDKQKKEEMTKYNQKLFAFQQQRQLFLNSNNNNTNEITSTNSGLQTVNTNQSENFFQVERNLDEELKRLNLYFQKKQIAIKEMIELCNQEIKKHRQILRENKQKTQDDQSILLNQQQQRTQSQSLETGELVSNSETNDNASSKTKKIIQNHKKRISSNSLFRMNCGIMEEITYNFYRIDSVELFFQELRNFSFIITSNILVLIGEVLIFSMFLIYVPGHEKLFTPTVNYFGDKSFTVFAFMVILPFTFINFVTHVIVFFWPNLRQEYLFLNKLTDFELLWGIEDDIMNQLNSDRHLQNLDSNNNNLDGSLNDDYLVDEMNPMLMQQKKRKQKTYNPFKWIWSKVCRNKNDVNDYGHVNTQLYNQFSNYNGFQSNMTNGLSIGGVRSRSNDNNESSDYYQNVINKLQQNSNVDPLQLNIDSSPNVLGQQDLAILSQESSNNRRNMSLISTHDLSLLSKASLITSNLTFKEIILVLMYRLKNQVVKWRLKSESATFVILILLIFGIICFTLGVFMSLTDVFPSIYI